MTKKEHMTALRNDPDIRYNCAQASVIPFAKELGLTEEQAAALTLNVGSGLGCGGLCGAVVGALIVLGGLGQPQEKRAELLKQFRAENNGMLDCAALVKAAADRGEPKKVHCDRSIAQCMDFVCKETGLE